MPMAHPPWPSAFKRARNQAPAGTSMRREAAVAVRITPLDNGPYMVEGEIELVSPSGQPIPVRGSKAFLCRCGASTRKPLCDGTHSRIGFQAAESAAARHDAARDDAGA